MAGAHQRYEEDQNYFEFNKKLAVRLRTARKAAGLTQDQMEEIVGISKSVLSKSENAEAPQKTSAYLVKRYAEICGQDIAFFFDDVSRADKDSRNKKIDDIRIQLTWLNETELDVVFSLIAQYLRVRK